MTTKTLIPLATLATLALLSGCAESDDSLRNDEASDFDRPSTARELSDMEDAIDLTLEDAAAVSGVVVLEQLEATVSGADPTTVPDEVKAMLREMAAAEPCPVRGVILGRYSPDVEVDLEDDALEAAVDGAFRLNGYHLDKQQVGDGEGIYGDGLAIARFSDLEDDDSGRAELTYGRDGDGYGTFEGAWVLDTLDGWGHVAGLWHDLADKSGGIGLGYWTRCF